MKRYSPITPSADALQHLWSDIRLVDYELKVHLNVRLLSGYYARFSAEQLDVADELLLISRYPDVKVMQTGENTSKSLKPWQDSCFGLFWLRIGR